MAWSRATAQCAKLTQLARRIAGWCHEPSWRDGTWRSLVSASVWGTEGREFESRRPDHCRIAVRPGRGLPRWQILVIGGPAGPCGARDDRDGCGGRRRHPGRRPRARLVLTSAMPVEGEYEPSPAAWVRDQ